MTKGKIVFTGSFWEYLGLSIVFLVLSVVTFGLLLPWFLFWSVKWFFTHMEIELYSVTSNSVVVHR